MNSPKKPNSLQEILKRRQQTTFVGREPQIAMFRQSLGQSPELRDYFILALLHDSEKGRAWT